MKIWIKVSNDEYELPVAVGDTAKEIAEITGVQTHSVIQKASDYRMGRKKKPTYICVIIEEDDKNEDRTH